MTSVLVHGVVAARDELELAAPSRWVRHGDVAAIVTDTDESGLRAASALRLHWQVLETTAGSDSVPPVRFGTAMADDRAVVEELLAPRHDELVSHLAELSGRVQITVKGTFDEERLLRGVVDASPAIARLRERVAGVPEAAAYYDRIRLGQLIAEEVEHARQHYAARVVERLEPLAAATSIERVSAADAAVNAAFLIQQELGSRSSGPRWTSSRASSAAPSTCAVWGRCRPTASRTSARHRGARHGPDNRLDHAAARTGLC